MVYCTRCGTLNPDNATNCSNCGAPLSGAIVETRPYNWLKHRHRYYEDNYGYYRRDRGFGLLIGGLIIILIAIGLFYRAAFWQYFWPLILLIIGVWLIALFIMRNRRHRQPPLQ